MTDRLSPALETHPSVLVFQYLGHRVDGIHRQQGSRGIGVVSGHEDRARNTAAGALHSGDDTLPMGANPRVRPFRQPQRSRAVRSDFDFGLRRKSLQPGRATCLHEAAANCTEMIGWAFEGSLPVRRACQSRRRLGTSWLRSRAECGDTSGRADRASMPGPVIDGVRADHHPGEPVHQAVLSVRALG